MKIFLIIQRFLLLFVINATQVPLAVVLNVYNFNNGPLQ